MDIPTQLVVGTQLRILTDLGFTLQPSHRVLDFGTGQCRTVHWLRHLGFEAFGCDISAPKTSCEYFRLMQDGHIPFADDSFDLIISEQVFEHVMDYDTAIREVYRVLKPGGISTHMFPSRFGLIECHVNVPLGAFFRPKWWLWLWAHLGVHSPEQAGMSSDEVYRYNVDFLYGHTNYPPTSKVYKHFRTHFPQVEFREDLLIKNNHKRAARIWPLAKRFSPVVWLYRTCRMRVVVCHK